MARVGLELNLDKTRIVYCNDSNRTGSHEHEQFAFLGYTFRRRRARSRSGEYFVSFCPAVADDAAKAIRRRIKRWRLHLWSGQSLADLPRAINPVVRGWINYYGASTGRGWSRLSGASTSISALGHAEIQAVAQAPHKDVGAPRKDLQARA